MIVNVRERIKDFLWMTPYLIVGYVVLLVVVALLVGWYQHGWLGGH